MEEQDISYFFNMEEKDIKKLKVVAEKDAMALDLLGLMNYSGTKVLDSNKREAYMLWFKSFRRFKSSFALEQLKEAINNNDEELPDEVLKLKDQLLEYEIKVSKK